MYFWDINSLKRDLCKGALSESETFKYLFAYLLCMSISYLPRSKPTEPVVVILSLIGPIILACGVYYCYRKNGGHKGQFFVQRFLPLIFVAGMRWGVMVFIPYLAIFVILVVSKILLLHTISLVAGIYIISVLFYWRIGQHLGDVSKEYERDNKLPVTVEASTCSDITF